MQIDEKFELLREKYSSVKEQNKILKEALKNLQAEVKSLYSKNREVEIEKQKQNEEIDALMFQQNRLNKQIHALSSQVNELQKQKVGWGGALSILNSNSSKEVCDKIKDELNVLKDELQRKIEENEELHMKIFELQREFLCEAEHDKKQIEDANEKIIEIEKEKDLSAERLEEILTNLNNLRKENDCLNKSLCDTETLYKEENNLIRKENEQISYEMNYIKKRFNEKIILDDSNCKILNFLNFHSNHFCIAQYECFKSSENIQKKLINLLKSFLKVFLNWKIALHISVPSNKNNYNLCESQNKGSSNFSCGGLEGRLLYVNAKLSKCLFLLEKNMEDLLGNLTKIFELNLKNFLVIQIEKQNEFRALKKKCYNVIKKILRYSKRFVSYQTLSLTLEDMALSHALVNDDKKLTNTFVESLQKFQRSSAALWRYYLILLDNFDISSHLPPSSLSVLHFSVCKVDFENFNCSSKLSFSSSFACSSSLSSSTSSISNILENYSNNKTLNLNKKIPSVQKTKFLLRKIRFLIKSFIKNCNFIEGCLSARMCCAPTANGRPLPLSGGSISMVNLVDTLRQISIQFVEDDFCRTLDEYISNKFLNVFYSLINSPLFYFLSKSCLLKLNDLNRRIAAAPPRISCIDAIFYKNDLLKSSETVKKLTTEIRRLQADFLKQIEERNRQKEEIRELQDAQVILQCNLEVLKPKKANSLISFGNSNSTLIKAVDAHDEVKTVCQGKDKKSNSRFLTVLDGSVSVSKEDFTNTRKEKQEKKINNSEYFVEENMTTKKTLFIEKESLKEINEIEQNLLHANVDEHSKKTQIINPADKRASLNNFSELFVDMREQVKSKLSTVLDEGCIIEVQQVSCIENRYNYENKYEEKELRYMYVQHIKQMLSQLRMADSVTFSLHNKLKNSLEVIKNVEENKRNLEEELSESNKHILNVKDDIDRTRKNYDSQIAMLTEHICELLERLAQKDEKLGVVEALKILCVRCGAWNTVGYLMTAEGGGSCNVCRGKVVEQPNL